MGNCVVRKRVPVERRVFVLGSPDSDRVWWRGEQFTVDPLIAAHYGVACLKSTETGATHIVAFQWNLHVKYSFLSEYVQLLKELNANHCFLFGKLTQSELEMNIIEDRDRRRLAAIRLNEDEPDLRTAWSFLECGAEVDVFDVVEGMLDALHALHQRSKWHGNINPWTVFLRRPAAGSALFGLLSYGLVGRLSERAHAHHPAGDRPLTPLVPRAWLNLAYCARGVHDMRLEQNDDYEALTYLVMALLLRGQLPWLPDVMGVQRSDWGLCALIGRRIWSQELEQDLCEAKSAFWKKPTATISRMTDRNVEFLTEFAETVRENWTQPSLELNAELKSVTVKHRMIAVIAQMDEKTKPSDFKMPAY